MAVLCDVEQRSFIETDVSKVLPPSSGDPDEVNGMHL
jgi:hypothetical protein